MKSNHDFYWCGTRCAGPYPFTDDGRAPGHEHATAEEAHACCQPALVRRFSVGMELTAHGGILLERQDDGRFINVGGHGPALYPKHGGTT